MRHTTPVVVSAFLVTLALGCAREDAPDPSRGDPLALRVDVSQVSAAGVTDRDLADVQAPSTPTSRPGPGVELQPNPTSIRLLVAITEDGFTINDLRQSPQFVASRLGWPTTDQPTGRAGVPATIPARPSGATLNDRLDFEGLYVRLRQIRDYPEWNSEFDETNDIVHLVADREVPLSAVVRTLEIASCRRDNANSPDCLTGDDGALSLFSKPMLLLPRAAR